jgi:PBP1b-binding outer membrane lipoprotein LpoB
MNRLSKSSLITGIALVLSGCQTMATDQDRPARIVNPDDASRAALQNTINTVLRTNVVIANNALTDSSVLVIERSPPRTMQNPNPQGLILETPIQFRLVINGSDCILIDARDNGRYVLENTSCEAEKN